MKKHYSGKGKPIDISKVAGAKCIDAPDMTGAKCIDVYESGKVGIPDDEIMYEKATSQCKVLLPVLKNPDCAKETRESVISIVKKILEEFQDAPDIKRRKEQIYLENPDFFPKESALIKAKIEVGKNIEKIKPEIKKRLQEKNPEDRISGVVAADRLVEGVKLGIIDKPKDVQSANRQAKKIRERLGIRLAEKGRN